MKKNVAARWWRTGTVTMPTPPCTTTTGRPSETAAMASGARRLSGTSFSIGLMFLPPRADASRRHRELEQIQGLLGGCVGPLKRLADARQAGHQLGVAGGGHAAPQHQRVLHPGAGVAAHR